MHTLNAKLMGIDFNHYVLQFVHLTTNVTYLLLLSVIFLLFINEPAFS